MAAEISINSSAFSFKSKQFLKPIGIWDIRWRPGCPILDGLSVLHK